MERATGCRVFRTVHGFVLAALVSLVLVLPAPIMAAHKAVTLGDDGFNCTDCHTLNSADGAQETGSKYITYGIRTLTNMRAAFGGAVPTGSYGCTFCHNNNTNTGMRGVFGHFSDISHHPMGETFGGFGVARVNTTNEYKSNFAGTTSAATNELDCVDCHLIGLLDDPVDPEIGHVKTSHATLGAQRTANPYMLIGVTAPGQYDAFCRTCHGVAAPLVKGVNVRMVNHKDGSDAGANALKEKDGTPLKVVACNACHQGHSSGGKKLFLATMDPSDGAKCTDCHYPGDAENVAQGYSYNKYGHGLSPSLQYASGKNGAGLGCNSCHGVNSNHDASAPAYGSKMFNAPPDTTPSRYNKDLKSVCGTCHGTLAAHNGGAGADVGCIDCHDEHAEGVGTTSNRYMIPQYLPNVYPRNIGVNTELSFFQSAGNSVDPTRWDYFVDDNLPRMEADMGASATSVGVCDNAICHAGKQAGTPPQNVYPLTTFMASGKHSLGVQTVGSNCKSCHKHVDPSGSWGASASCDDCHGDGTGTINTTGSPRTHGNTTESLAVHTKHAVSGLVPGGCPDCHPHDGKTDSPTSSIDGTLHMDGIVQFGGARMPGATLDYAVMAFGGTCAAVNGCHDSEAGEWKNGLNFVNNDACADCHSSTAKTLSQPTGYPPTTNKHGIHDSPYVPGDGVTTYHCTDCHGGSADAGNHAGHLNGSVTVATSGVNVDITDFNATNKTCLNSCHVVGLGVVTKSWTTVTVNPLVCMDCHAGTYIGGDRTGTGGVNSLPQSGLHATNSANMSSQNPHDDSFKATPAAADGTAFCTTCHTTAPSNPAAAHVNGTLLASTVNFAAGLTYSASPYPGCTLGGSLATCHSDGVAWRRKWSATADDNTVAECDNCHGMFKGSVGTGDNTWVAGISSRHGDADNNGGLESNHNGSPAGGPCLQCHTSVTDASGFSSTQGFAYLVSQHRDGSIQLNNQNQLNDNGATIGCAGCHGVTGLTADGLESIVMADTLLLSGGLSRWGRVLQPGPVGDCDTCHDSTLLAASGFTAHNGAGESLTMHTAHQSGPYITGCDACHTNNGSGADHNNLTVNFKPAASGGLLDSTLNYARTATFANTNCSTVNLCHNSDLNEWDLETLGTDACVDCHKSGTKLLGNGKAATSGLHVVTATANVTAHDENLAAGNCVNCHATMAAAPASHLNNVWEADGAANQAGTQPRFLTRAGMTYAEAAPNSATCSAPGAATGLDGCHSDSGEWSRLWSTEADLDYMALNTNRNPGNAVCNVCHGQYATLNAKGWRPGTSHYTSSDLADRTQENKGIIHTDAPASAACEDCHAYYGTAGHENGSITFSDGAPTGYTLTLNTTPNPDTRHCSTCHDSQSAESAALTASHTFYDSTAFPGPNGVNHVDGVSEPTGCSGCHGNSATDTMWPWLTATTDVTAYPNRDGNHVKHVTVIMTRLNDTDGWAATPAGTRTMAQGGMSQADALEICAFCHTDDSPLGSGNFGHGTHYVSTWSTNKLAAQPADVLREPAFPATLFKPIWNKAGTDANGDFVATAYTGNVVNAGTSACNTIDCHNNKNTTTTTGVDFRWYGANTSSCIMCHNDVTNNAVPTGLTHNAHVNGTTNFGGTAMTCPTCHTGTVATSWSGNLAPAGPPTGGHINNTLEIVGSANLTYASQSCGTNVCHTRGYSDAVPSLWAPYNVGGGTYSWGTAYADCTLCHGDKLTPAAFNAPLTAHAAHLNSSLNFGRDVTCNDCHTPANVGSHLNGSVTFSGAVTYSLAGNAITGAPAWGTCNAGVCHNNGLGAPLTAAVNPVWNAGLLTDCTLCHLDAAGLATNSHNEHLRFPTAPCADCHALETAAATHMNGSINFNAANVTYSRGAAVINDATTSDIGTCSTVNCHDKGAVAPSEAWNIGVGVDLACDACHYWTNTFNAAAATAAANYAGGGANAMSSAHGDHFTRGKSCVQCHAAVATTAHINGSTTTTNAAVAVLGEAATGVGFGETAAMTKYTYAGGDRSCYSATNFGWGCHASAGDTGALDTSKPSWNTAFADCTTYCHSNKTDTQSNPTSGLHGVVPSVTGEQHDESFGSGLGCANCHNVAALGTHQNGTFTGDGSQAGDLTNMGLQNFTYANSANNAGTCTNTAAGCHDTTRNVWGHKWLATPADYTSATLSCAGCHGDWNNGWNAGVDHRTTSGTLGTHGDQGTQYDCYECHVLESAAYTFTFNSQDWNPLPAETSHHGDGTIQINANTAVGGTPTNYDYVANVNLCVGCHTPPDTTHNFVDTAWPISTALTTALKITADCNTCHGGQTAGQTPILGNVYPDSITAVTYPDKAGAHVKHMAISGVTCVNCHPGNPPAGHGQPPTAEHATPTTAEVTRTDTGGAVGADVWLYAEGWNAVSGTAVYFKTASGTNDTDAYYTEATKTCSNIYCHGDTGTTTPAWYGTAPDTGVPTLSVAPAAVPASIQSGTATVTLNATCNDATTGNSNIVQAEYFVVTEGVAGTGTAMTAVDTAFNSATEAVTATVDSSLWVAGTTALFVDCKDAANNWGPAIAGTVNVTVTAKDTFTAAIAAGATQNVYRGQDNVTMAVVTFTDDATGSSVLITNVQVTGTAGTGTPNANVSLVKIYNDGTGATPNVWDAADTLLGSGTMNASNIAAIDITDQTVASGTPLRTLIVYDIYNAATNLNTLGANLSGVTTATTDNLTTALPLNGTIPKTVVTGMTFYADSNTGTTIASGGTTLTNYGTSCTATGQTRGTFYSLLSSPEACLTNNIWTNNAANQDAFFIFNQVIDPTVNYTVAGAAAGNLFNVTNNSGANGTFTVAFVQFNPTTGAVPTLIGAAVTSATVNNGVTFNANIGLGSITGTLTAGNKFGIRIRFAASTWRLNMNNSRIYVVATLTPTADAAGPTLSVAAAAVPASIQQGTPTVTLNATCSDVASGNSNIVAAEYFTPTEGVAGTGTAMTAFDGAFSATAEAVTRIVDSSTWSTGTTNLYVDCKDAANNWGPATAGIAPVTVTAKDQFTVAGAAGATESVSQGSTNKTVNAYTFTVTSGTSIQVQALQITGTKGVGTGNVYADVALVEIYNDNGSSPNVWDATDTPLGTATFNTSNIANVDITDTTVNSGTPVRMLLVYDISAAATAGDVIGGNLTAVTNPPTDNLTTALPVASGNIKTVTAPAIACGDCHLVPPASGAHAAHVVVNTDYTDCEQCHGVVAGGYTTSPSGTHNNGSVSFVPAITYSNGGTPGSGAAANNDTCLTTNCHSPGTGYTSPNYAIWGTPTSVDCTDCHYYQLVPDATNNGLYAPPLSAGHNKHFAASKACTACHPNNTAQTVAPRAHLTGVGANDGAILLDQAIAVVGEAQISYGGTTTYTTGAATPWTCTPLAGNGLGCHATGAPNWLGNTTLCTACHTNTTTSAVNPTSGLHNASAAGVTPHNGALGAGNCVNCHTSTPSSLHFNGTLNPSAGVTPPPASYAFQANVTYSSAGYPASTTCAASGASCHAGAGDNGTWNRSWYGFQDVSMTGTELPTAAVCNNCHGSWSNGWNWSEVNATTTDHTNPSALNPYGDAMNVAGKHPDCKLCHGWGNAAYLLADHQNGSITMNGPQPTTGAGYNDATGGCSNALCHGTTYVMNTTSGWSAQYKDFGTGTCDSCHGGGTTGNPATVKNYWPDNVGGSNDAGRHLKHIEDLAARVFNEPATNTGLLMNASPAQPTLTSDVKQKRLCAYCHVDPAGGNFIAGLNLHNNGSANVTIPSNYMHQLWQTYAVDFASNDTVTVPVYDRLLDTCANVDCHNNKLTTDGTYGWYDAGAYSCLICHTKGGTTNDPISGLHRDTPAPPTISQTAHDESFAPGYPGGGLCTTCHTLAARTPTSTHVNGAFTGDGTAGGDKSAMGLFADYIAVSAANYGTGTCAGATVGATGCHDLGDGGTWKREWDSVNAYAILSSMTPCKGCHGATNADFTYGLTHVLADGQTEHAYNWDGDASPNNPEVMAVGTHDGCKTCHGVATSALPTSADPNYTVGGSFWRGVDGTSMHGNGSIEMNGPTGTGVGYNQTTWSCDTATACHGNNTALHNLEDSNWGINVLNFGGALCTSCHGYPPTTTGHAAGMTPVNHSLLRGGGALPSGSADVSVKHNECGYCHGVTNNVANDGFIAINPATLGGTYTYDIVGTTDHRNGSVTMNGGPGAGYDAASGWCTTAACHGANANHAMSSGAPTATLRNFGPGLCQTCHQDAAAAAATGATIVPWNVANKHVYPTGVLPASEACTSCHTGHADGSADSNNHVEIKTRQAAAYTVAVPTMNEQYATHSYAINLGGTATLAYGKSTEAEICWACHYTNRAALGDVNLEWGVNSNPNTGTRGYNYGTLDSWGSTNYGGWWKGAAVAVWSSGTSANAVAERFTYKSGGLQSMHGGMYNSAAPGTDTAGNIRCSYCHDVHDTRPDGVNGPPYLRGTWTGNPFPEDGAPQAGQTYPDPNVSTLSALGYFPRIKMSSKLGGFQINQNNTAATTGITTTNMAGLCETCHGGGDGVWTAAEIDTINWTPYGTSDLGWVGTSLPTTYQSTGTNNGHANSVIGGTGGTSGGAADVYSEGIRNPLFKIGTADGVGSGSPSMRMMHNTDGTFNAKAPYGFRGHTSEASSGNAWNFAPQLSAAGILNTDSRSFANSRTGMPWGSNAALTINTTVKTINNKYHQFPCSKCHNPHASRLPRLMITNCLDIRHQSFNPTGAGSGVPATQPWINKASENVSVYNKGMKWFQTTAAVNCHRRADSSAPGYTSPTSGNHRGAGWNRVTPW